MKFARYLQDTQVPEWKRAYIDYRGLKKHISAVKGQQETEDRRYRSSLYLGTPVRQALGLSATGHNNKENTFRPNLRHSLTFPLRTKQPHVNVKETTKVYYPNFFDSSTSVSSGSKTLCTPLHELPPKFNGMEMEFIHKLDSELDKIDAFYLRREEEAKEMLTQLKRQLQELKDHEKSSQQSKSEERRLQFPLNIITSRLRADSPPIATPDGRFGAVELRRAKKKLRLAVLEHYKKLDALENYRRLNLTGFQKVLKKWDKVTHMAIHDSYLKTKVEPRGFSSSKLLDELLKETEELYRVHFASGNKKRALYHLRAGWKQKTHYFVTFRSGIYLGLAIPALASGLYHVMTSSHVLSPLTSGLYHDNPPSAEDEIWDGLLVIYATIFVPVLFSLMVAINILVWTKVRINHVFIFGLDVKSKIDYQQYVEIPAILLLALCFSFWLSFNGVGSHIVSPQTWPLVWFGFSTLILCNPFPVQHRSSRMWLIKRFARLLVSGLKRVEFTDFWMGDQICSLNFSFTNLYFIGCIYGRGFSLGSNTQCGAQGPHWVAYVMLSVSPFFCRFIQSLRRWHDSRLATHLINAGKYTTGMLMYGMYYYWRHYRNKTSFVLYILAAILYNVYACIWDYLTDWSLLRIHSKYPLLRDEVLCADHLPFYYFAIITNMLIRFSWIIYLPTQGLPSEIRSFIVAMFEMFRRWQWNFLRLENEHLGNIDQYRVTRDVPLPYVFDSSQDSDNEDWGQPDMSTKGWVGRNLKS